MNETILKELVNLSVGGLLLSSSLLAVDARYRNQTSNQTRQYSLVVEEVSIEQLGDLKEMFTVFINDEYKARAEYQAIIDEFGVQSPFTNLVKVETMHINALTRLFEAYGLEVPSDNGSKYVVVPDSLEEVYRIGVEAEENNIALYDKYLDKNLSVAVERVFTNLQNASENHKATFEAYENGKTTIDCTTTPMMQNRNLSTTQNMQFSRNRQKLIILQN